MSWTMSRLFTSLHFSLFSEFHSGLLILIADERIVSCGMTLIFLLSKSSYTGRPSPCSVEVVGDVTVVTVPVHQ